MLLSRDIRHSYKKYPILFSPLTTGEMILSGGKDGMVAVSSPRTGMTVRILADHKGSAITVLQCMRKQVGTCLCVPALRGSEFPVLWEGAAAWLGRLSHSALGPANFCWAFFRGSFSGGKPCALQVAWESGQPLVAVADTVCMDGLHYGPSKSSIP